MKAPKNLMPLLVGIGVFIGVAFLANNQNQIQEQLPDDGGRQVLCIGIIANTNNVARDNDTLIRICKDVGIDRADFPPTTASN